MKLLIPFFFILFSCNEYAPIQNTPSGIFVTASQLKIDNYVNEIWRVGPLKRQKVSKGFRLDITFPYLKRSDLDTLLKEYGVNAWLIKIRKRAYSVNTVLGYLYIPLIIPGIQGKSKYRRHQIKQGAISVYYAAAAISKRFENFICPAFDHNKTLDDVEIDDRTISMDRFFAGRQTDTYVAAKVEKFSYSGNTLNGGQSLEGEYTIQVAMYNS